MTSFEFSLFDSESSGGSELGAVGADSGGSSELGGADDGGAELGADAGAESEPVGEESGGSSELGGPDEGGAELGADAGAESEPVGDESGGSFELGGADDGGAESGEADPGWPAAPPPDVDVDELGVIVMEGSSNISGLLEDAVYAVDCWRCFRSDSGNGAKLSDSFESLDELP